MKNITTTWQEYLQDVPLYPSLKKDSTCDVIIIGGGIVGITSAYFLAQAGKSVIVVDKGTLFTSVSAYTTAFLTLTIDTNLTDIEKLYKGKEAVKKVLESHEVAIDTIEAIIAHEKIECEFKRVPNYEIAFTQKGYKQLQNDAAISNAVGQEVIPLKKGILPLTIIGGTESTEQALFHPTKYLHTLRERTVKLGVQFFEKTKAIEIRGKETITVTMENGVKVTARNVITATYNPFRQPWWYIFKKGMYITYVYEIEIAHGLLPEAMYEDDNNPYFYFRIDAGKGKNKNKDRMIVGGADHRKEIPFSKKSGYRAIDAYLTETLGIKEYEIKKRWSGPILEQTDGLAYIGRLKDATPNRYVATAFSGNGMTYGTISGLLLTDLILGKKNPWEQLYRPARSVTARDVMIKGRDYIGELIQGIGQHLFSRNKKKKQ